MTLESLSEFPFEQQELQNIFSEDSSALVAFLIKLDSYLFRHSYDQASFPVEKLEFLIQSLDERCAGLDLEDKILVLNDLMFNTSGFIAKTSDSSLPEDFSLHNFFSQKKGNCLLLSLIYQFLAQRVDLPVYAISLPPYSIVKWYRGDKSLFIDLSHHGRTFNQIEILEYLNKAKLTENSFEILTIKQLFLNYIQGLILAFRKSDRLTESLACLSLLIQTNENDLESLRERAQIYFDRGEYNLSYSDVKRFLSFVDLSCAPDQIQVLNQKLKFMRDSNSPLVLGNEIIH